MGFFDGGSSSYSSDSFSGLRSRDNDAFNKIANRTPGDYNFLQNNLQSWAKSPIPGLNLGADGLLAEQRAGVNTLGQNLFSAVSGNYAKMGLMNPQNVSGVIGSAVTQASPGLLDLIGSNVRDSILMPEQIKQNRFAALNNAMSAVPGLLGQESHMTGRTTSPGIGYTFGNSFANTLGQGLAQWFSPNTSGNAAKMMF